MMFLSLDARTRIPEGVLVRELDDESVILDLNTGMYFGLDDVGTRMWHACTESPSLAAAYVALLDEFDVAPEQLREDLDGLVRQLVEHGLLRVDDPEIKPGAGKTAG